MPPEMPPYHPPLGPLRVIHKDEGLVFVDKPPGLLSVPGKGAGMEDCLEARLKAHVPGVWLVHRLDMDTSGLMVFGRDYETRRHLGTQFEERRVSKTYVAEVAGRLSGEGEIDLPLIADWPNRPLQKVCHIQGKPARTRWAAEPGDRTSRVTLWPETGRSHQLRVHLASLGHPIIGDRFYGGLPAPRLMLHAAHLSLSHPRTGEVVSAEVAPGF